MEYSIHVTIDVASASVHLSSESESGSFWSVRLEGSTHWRADRIYDENNKKLPSKWSVTIHETRQLNEHLKAIGGIGSATYLSTLDDLEYGHDACFEAWVTTSADTITNLVSAINSGCIPELIQIHIRDLSFGGAPDGSEVIWDTSGKDTSSRAIEKFNLQYKSPLLEANASAREPAGEELPLRAPLHAHVPTDSTGPLASAMRWAVALLALIAGLIAWK